MADYSAPLRDMQFVLKEVFDVETLWQNLPKASENADIDTAEAILEEAGKISANLLAPINRTGDEEACQWNDGQVTTPSGFKEAYQTFIEGGWCGLGGNPEYGGMGMPKMIGAQVEEMVQSANISFGLYPMLTAGACLCIDKHATEELKEKYLPKMYEGVWAGSMDLTEAHSGSDLGIIRTKAVPLDDGSYSVTGSKIFITAGDHDLTENIIHLVLAKLPDAPAGPRGISLFLVPKILVSDDGSLGAANNVSCGSIEHKMGIKGSATCVVNYDDSKGWLIGEVNKGLGCMFTMMNYERLGVGVQGLAAGERSYQSAVEYAKDRLQGRAPSGKAAPDKIADPIIVHPDIRRMLLTMRAMNEGSRCFSSYVARYLDISKFSENPSEKAHAEAMVALLTPVAKAFLTDRGLESTVHGQQVFGGHGYVREWGQEQLVRDVRIAQIYEGTNGIQAMDLVGRKVVANSGKFCELFANEVAEFIEANRDNPEMQRYIEPLAASMERLSDVTEHLIKSAATDRNAIGAASTDYLDLFGYTSFGYMWAKMAKVALDKQAGDTSGFYDAKIKTPNYYFSRLLPRTISLAECVKSGSEDMMALTEEQF
jgi:alkylation response protein AidB-like acyl-CoA dehydrogenase